jgi:hypothetical protein
MSVQLVMSSSFPLSNVASPSVDIAASASFSGNASSCRLTSRAKIKVLNLHHRRGSPSSDRLIHTLHCYKKVISTLITLPITQSCLYSASSLARAPHHRSYTHCHRFLSPSSHTHRPSAQRYSWCQTSWPSFIFPNNLSNLCKKIF